MRTRFAVLAELTEARARVYELEAELALLDPERCRLAVVVGVSERHEPVLTVRTERELCEVMGWHYDRRRADRELVTPPVTIVRVAVSEEATS
jgi:hypothetical protein